MQILYDMDGQEMCSIYYSPDGIEADRSYYNDYTEC